MEITEPGRYTIDDGTVEEIIIRSGESGKIEIDIGHDCSINIVSIYDKPIEIDITNNVGKNSRIHTNSLWISGCRGKITNNLIGDHSEAYDLNIFINKSGNLELDTKLRHTGVNTKGDILVKGIVMKGSRATMNGMIKIDKSGKGAESILKEYVLLLDNDAHAIAKPDLEIENNDVVSTHSASVSQIDEEKIFYMCSRGLSREDAKRLIVEGFLLAPQNSKYFEKEILSVI